MKQTASERVRDLFESYTRDFSSEDLQRLFTHDTRDAYRFFARGLDEDVIDVQKAIGRIGNVQLVPLFQIQSSQQLLRKNSADGISDLGQFQ